ncbi:MAG: DUF2782 domain-containing protein [Luteimonas sp.]
MTTLRFFRTLAAASASALFCVSALSSCATADLAEADIPADAVSTTHTESNGDVITEYRIAGQLRTVRVAPAHGPAYYLSDSNGDGRLDKSKGEVSPVYYKLFEWN